MKPEDVTVKQAARYNSMRHSPSNINAARIEIANAVTAAGAVVLSAGPRQREILEYAIDVLRCRKHHYSRRITEADDGSDEWTWAKVERDRSHEAILELRNLLARATPEQPTEA